MRTHGEADKVLINHRSLAFHLSIPGAERVGQPLDLDAANDEIVQGQLPGFRIVLGQNVLNEGGTEAITHLLKSCKNVKQIGHFVTTNGSAKRSNAVLITLGQLVKLNRSRLVTIEGLKSGLPGINALKHLAELIDIDGATIIGIVKL